ncbi:MAG: glycosyltransferase family 2 protein [Candidatus Wolfebacteria bacterium]|nr:glycosyltransferase family 2 protein [Candidatus Wolfebacteria bacterium]
MSQMRLYEFIPGFLSWITIILMFLLSWLFPAGVAIFIILFDIYWLLKTIYLSLHLRSTFVRMKKNLKINWLAKLTHNLQPTTYNWKDIYHLIILPMYNEPYEIVKESFDALINTNYPKDKFIIVLATEQRAGQIIQETAKKIEENFGNKFFKFLITTHPADLPNEIPGKGSNETWAGKQAKILIDQLKISYENILVSVFDVDTQVPLDYFGILTYTFLTAKNPQRSSFQPISLFTNNIFQAPALARVIAFSSTFWHMIQQSRPERLTTFSSHSMPFKAIVEIGFWQTDIVSEDSRIFWQCYIHYNGDWRVVPLDYPVSMDANVAPTFWQTMINQYKQQRRWGWGCENIPYLLDGFKKNKKISWTKKLYWKFNYIEGFHSWATNSLIIFALGWLPIILGGPDFKFSILSYNLPFVTKTIMNLAMIGIITSAVLGVVLLPPKPKWFKKRHYFLYFIQWILMPFTLIIFGAFPAIESQTRLMLGGKFKLGFWVTPKHRNAAQQTNL